MGMKRKTAQTIRFSQVSHFQVSRVRSLQSSALAESNPRIFSYLMLAEVCCLCEV